MKKLNAVLRIYNAKKNDGKLVNEMKSNMNNSRCGDVQSRIQKKTRTNDNHFTRQCALIVKFSNHNSQNVGPIYENLFK